MDEEMMIEDYVDWIKPTNDTNVMLWQIANQLVQMYGEDQERTPQAVAKEIAAVYRILWAANVNPQNPPTMPDSK